MLAIGLMSGTSADGVDAALIETDGKNQVKVIEHYYLAYPKDFQQELKSCFGNSEVPSTIIELLTNYHISAVKALLEKTKLKASDVKVIGFHGQTILHKPNEKVTYQIGDPKKLAETVNIGVVFNLRQNDIEHGGQGAPLVPIYHQALAANMEKPIAFINLGGISNITYINKDKLLAFDIGPACSITNDFAVEYFNKSFDEEGELAAKGNVNTKIISKILNDEYFKLNYPKSLDRNYFKKYYALFAGESKFDVMATSSALIIAAIEKSLKLLPANPNEIIFCGGGVHNLFLMQGLREALHKYDIKIYSAQEKNLNPNSIEAEAFAYLAVRSLLKLPITFPTTTGSHQALSGGVYYSH